MTLPGVHSVLPYMRPCGHHNVSVACKRLHGNAPEVLCVDKVDSSVQQVHAQQGPDINHRQGSLKAIHTSICGTWMQSVSADLTVTCETHLCRRSDVGRLPAVPSTGHWWLQQRALSSSVPGLSPHHEDATSRQAQLSQAAEAPKAASEVAPQASVVEPEAATATSFVLHLLWASLIGSDMAGRSSWACSLSLSPTWKSQRSYEGPWQSSWKRAHVCVLTCLQSLVTGWTMCEASTVSCNFMFLY